MASSIRMLLCLLCLLSLTPGFAAQLRYLGNQPDLALRAGPDAKQPIIRMLPVGAPVQVLEAAAGGWSKVKTQDGSLGWVLARNLMAQPPLKAKNQSADKKSAGTNPDLTQQIAQNELALREAQAAIDRLTQEKETLARQLQTAQEGLKLSNTNQQLREQVATLQHQLQGLEEQVEQLADHSRQDWFITGAGVLLAGLLLGLFIPRLRPQRRRDRW
jgi:SH3 domain protein